MLKDVARRKKVDDDGILMEDVLVIGKQPWRANGV
jgi:hypothetical protein